MAHTKQFSYLHILAIIILMMMLRLSTNMWRHHFIHYLYAIHYIYVQYAIFGGPAFGKFQHLSEKT